MKPINALSASKLAQAITHADATFRALLDEMIAAGRGHERPTETRTKSDPLSARYMTALEHCSALEAEQRKRTAYHGNLRPIKQSV